MRDKKVSKKIITLHLYFILNIFPLHDFMGDGGGQFFATQCYCDSLTQPLCKRH